MKQRNLKVYEAPGQSRDIPRINLQGKWLSDLGYHVGDHIVVTCDNHGKLTIELNPNAQEARS